MNGQQQFPQFKSPEQMAWEYEQYEKVMRRAMKKRDQEKAVEHFIGALTGLVLSLALVWFMLGQPDYETIITYLQALRN